MTNDELPKYVEDRIRKPPPAGLPIVKGSTPVVAFGNFRKSRVATIAWNPSKSEFLDKKGNELIGSKRRLETLASLEITDLASAPTETILRVFDGSNRYFQRRPYRQWFNVLEKLLRLLGASYYDGTACHLDLVQWATDPTWGKLQGRKNKVIDDDLEFLKKQLSEANIKLLLLNGSGLAKECRIRLGCHIAETAIAGVTGAQLFTGRTEGVQVIGWNQNLQRKGSDGYIQAVANAVKQARSQP